MATREELLAFFASLTPQQRYEMGFGPPPAGQQSDTPKFSPALDQVAEADIPRVVEACRQGIRSVAEGGQDADAAQFLAQVSPALANAAVRNSTHRRKSIVHSLNVACTYLQSAECAAKREEKKRRVPPSRPARPVASSPQGTFLVPSQEQPTVGDGGEGEAQ